MKRYHIFIIIIVTIIIIIIKHLSSQLFLLVDFVLFADIARSEVCEERGVEQLFDLLRKQLNVESQSAGALRKVACGFLFNLTNTHGAFLFDSNCVFKYL